MKTKTLFAAVVLGLAVLYAPLASAQWVSSKRAPTVYNPNTDNSATFTAPTTVKTSHIITGVSWDIAPYTNGSTVQTYQLCYAQPYTSAFNSCIGVSGNLVGTSSYFNGQSAKGDFKIIVNLSGGGTFPALPGANQYFSLQVNYQ